MITEYPAEDRRYDQSQYERSWAAATALELAWAPHLLSTMDYAYRERHGEGLYRFKSLPS